MRRNMDVPTMARRTTFACVVGRQSSSSQNTLTSFHGGKAVRDARDDVLAGLDPRNSISTLL